MQVAELQSFIRSLVGPLLCAGATKKVSEDIERVAAALEPFKALGVPVFADFLAKAEEYQRTGVLPATATPRRGTRAPKAAALSLVEAAQRVMALYERAADPDLQYDAIEAEIAALDKVLSAKNMTALAREVGISKPLRTKKAARDEIKRKITDRKGSFERTQFRAAPVAESSVL